MVSQSSFRKLALSFEDAEELPHFHLASFRYKKKIFSRAIKGEEKDVG